MSLDELETIVRSVHERAVDSVVAIGRNGRGTGFVVDRDRVLTNAHNLRDRTVSVTFSDGRVEQATLHAADVDGDLAVLDVPTGSAGALELSDASAGIGAAVVALGRGGHRSRASVGFVSGVGQSFRGPRGRAITGSLEHTAPIARGASGGPVFDRSGRVVAINTHRSGDGFYLARVVDDVLRARLTELLAGRSPQRRMLGVALAPSDVAAQLRRAVGLAERDGLLVRGVEDGGPAHRAGVEVGDLLVSAGGRELRTVDDLSDTLDRTTGASIDLGIVRGVEERTLHVSFTETPAA
jgi:S1-C subfamily serine protease